MDLNTSVGKRLKHLRKSKGLTQEHLAEKCNISVHHISGLERGLHSVSLSTLEHISLVLGVSIRDFFEPEKKRKQTDFDNSIDILLKYLYKMNSSNVKFLTLIAKRLKTS